MITGLIIYIFIAFVFWCFFYGLEFFLNDGLPGNIFFSFWRDFLWNMPGGTRRKADFLKKIIREKRGIINGRIKSWDYDEVCKKNLYIDCAKDIFGTRTEFWIFNILAPFLWPLSVFIIFLIFKRHKRY